MDSIYSNAPSQWPQNITDQAVDPSLSSNDDWKDRSTATSSSSSSGAGGSTTTAQPGLDLNDFGLGDIPAGPSTSSSISPPPQSYFPQSFPPFYVPSVPGPYNAMPYGAISWSTQPTPLPLTTYSTLNGATSASQASTSQQQQASLPANSTQSQMMIDPVLTTMGGSESAQHYPQSSNHENVQRTQSQQPQSQQQQQQTQYSYQQPTLSINPAYVLPSHFYSSQHQQSQVQTTLSPHVLHTPSTPQPGIHSSASAAASSSTANSEARRTKLSTDIRSLLLPNSFSGAGAVNSLVGRLDDYGSQDVDPLLRFEILTKIRDNAGNHYFRAWLENPTAMDITREWLKAGLTAKSDTSLADTIMPLLHIVDRLPMTVDALKLSKLGKIIVKLSKDPPCQAVKDMAANLERKWRQLVEAATKQVENNSTEDTKLKKRKLNEPPAAKALPPMKKAALSSVSAPTVKATVAKKETKPGVPAVKDSRSDSSFFSAPKPKPKLPSFKKAPVTVKKEPDPNIAQPSSIDPFQEALKSMGKVRKESPAAPTPPSAASTPSINFAATTTAVGKMKRKTVTWAPDSQLESIRLIERAVYDDDPVDGVHTAHSLRDLDRGEGAALHAYLFEELIDWMDPIPIDIPIDIEVPQRGQQSSEKSVQEEREQTALGALYMNAAQIPDSPGEPSMTIPEEEVDADVKLMTVGPESDHIIWSDVPQQVSVADLVRQLASGAVDQVMGLHPANGSTAMSLGFDPSILTTIPPEQMQQLMQQAQALFGSPSQGQPGAQPAPNFSGVDQSWNVSTANSNTYGSDFGQHEYSDDTNHTNRGRGRGRGRGGGNRGGGRGRGGDDGSYRSSKRKPCSFFAEGRRALIYFASILLCKYGDQCDFSHEPIY
ncbi:hypothetical protein F5141DRAFT_1010544 [Pisolithus sp. B1]|nr:hypothetical protein F5141DRAFT_1010544 [Pisolithus sp. B1]